jgi:hypothetical protein
MLRQAGNGGPCEWWVGGKIGFGQTGFGEIRFGKIGFGETGFGKIVGNPL